jgi:peroxiredoxin
LIFNAIFSFAQVRITGKIENAQSKEITLTYFKSYSNDKETLTQAIKEDGSFEFIFDIDEISQSEFSFGGQSSIDFHFSPQQEVFIKLDGNASNIFENMTFSGKDAPIFDFQTAFSKKNASRVLLNLTKSKEKDINDPLKYLTFCDSVQSALDKFVDNYQVAHPAFPKSYAEEFKIRIVYRLAGAKLSYPDLNAIYNNLTEKIKVPTSYYDFTKKLVINADSLSHLREFRDFVSSYINKNYVDMMNMAKRKDFSWKIFYEYHKIILSGKSRSAVLGNMVDIALHFSKFEEIEPIYKDFISWNTNTKQNEALTKMYEKIGSMASGKFAPDFSLKDLEGKKVSLADFKGKIVYIDFWASWCKPCIKEFPAAKKLKEKFKDKDVVFLYIDIDASEKDWKEGVKEHLLEGVNLYAGAKSEVAKAYNVSGIPAYFLVDKQGKIYHNAPPRPSSNDIEKILEEALSIK